MSEVAAASHVPVETLRKIEAGRVPTPAFFTIAAIAAAVGVRLADLAELTEAAAVNSPTPGPGEEFTASQAAATA